MHTCVRAMGVYQQLEWSCTPWSFLCTSTCQQLGRLGSRGQLPGKLSVSAQPLVRSTMYICTYFLLLSHLSCHRGEEGEAVGAVCAHVSAGCFCLCYLCVWPATYTYRSCTGASAGNTFAATLLAGLGVTELWQPCLCQTAGFRYIP